MLRRTALAAVIAALAGVVPAAARIDPDLLAGMQARSIGPAGMSGRISDIDAVAADPDTIFVGSSTGGLWKTENGGDTWEPVFDDQPVQSIGAVAIFQANPDIVWTGTGEGNLRNSVSIGNGVYRSVDGGKTWTHLGLAETERIHRIVLHPTDPEVAWVAALGRAWGENPERGVYRTTDGGRTWEKVLYADPRTGAGDLVLDPGNPQKLFAAMWEHRRWPWSFRSGGPGSGLYRSVDGGKTWTRLTREDGLPAGDLGRIGVAISRSNPDVVYALVEAERNALLRSDDGGLTFRTVNAEPDVAPRPFYYADLRVDPERPDRVYNLWSLLTVSDDGGRTFRILASYGKVHPDHHALWIHPDRPDFLIDGNDGGVYTSRDRGRTWRFVANLPLAQYYHVAVDMEEPYHVYGGMQDNGSWRGPAAVWENGGIRNHHWQEVGFGDGFDTRPDPEDPLRGYSMSQQGYLKRWNLRTGEVKDIRPPKPDGTELRFNWNSGFATDPFDPATIYYGSQFLHRSTDRGDTWETISPDLTTNRPEWQKQAESGGLTPDVTGAENFTTIMAVAPSPVAQGVIWVGTDDGRIQVTRDGGRNWESVEGNLRGVPPDTWVPHIVPSRFESGTAFVLLDDHRRSNFTPYVFRAEDFGRRFRSLVTRDLRGYAHSIAQDPIDSDLLFLGTEFGLWVSIDGGGTWLPFRHGVPAVGVHDLLVHPRDHDLVLGTHGRSALILDDVSPLRGLDEQALAEPLHLFPIPNARQYRARQSGGSRFPADGEFRGENRPYGALITVSLNVDGLPAHAEWKARREKEKRAKEWRQIQSPQAPAAGEDKKKEEEKGPQVKVRVRDGSGELIRTFEVPVHRGVNRIAWDLRRDPFPDPPGSRASWWEEPRGPEVPPGRYGIRVEYGDHATEGEVTVLADPRFDIPEADRGTKYATILRAGNRKTRVADAVRQVQETLADIDSVAAKARAAREKQKREEGLDDDAPGPLRDLLEAAKALRERVRAAERRFWTPPDTKGYIKRDDSLTKIEYVLGSLQSSWDAPTAAQRTYLRQAEERLEESFREWNRVLTEEVAPFRSRAEELGFGLFPAREPLHLEPAEN